MSFLKKELIQVKELIFNKTVMMPAIYDNGTHFVTNQKLTVESSKEYLILKMFWKLLMNILVALEDFGHPKNT